MKVLNQTKIGDKRESNNRKYSFCFERCPDSHVRTANMQLVLYSCCSTTCGIMKNSQWLCYISFLLLFLFQNLDFTLKKCMKCPPQSKLFHPMCLLLKQLQFTGSVDKEVNLFYIMCYYSGNTLDFQIQNLRFQIFAVHLIEYPGYITVTCSWSHCCLLGPLLIISCILF